MPRKKVQPEETPSEKRNRLRREKYAQKKAEKESHPNVQPKAKAPRKTTAVAKETPKSSGGKKSVHCEICGKPLTRSESMNAGVGDVCAHKLGKLAAGVTLEDHIQSHTVAELPEGYIKVKDAHAELMRTKKKHGISGYRFNQGYGGNSLMMEPVNEHFRVVFYKGARWIPASCLNHLEDLRKI